MSAPPPVPVDTNPGAPPSVAADEPAARAAEQALYGPGVRGRLPGWFYSFLPNKLGLGATINLPPIFLTEILGGNVASVGVASALTSAATVPAAAAWGWLSDRYGTRKIYLILGYLGFAIPTLLTAFTVEVWHYMLLAVLLGAWSVAGTPVSSTLIMDTVPRSEWDETFGRFNAINGWGVVAGRLLGLATITFGIPMLGSEPTQRGLWLISGIISLLSVVWALGTVPQPRMPKPRPPRAYEPAAARYTGLTLVDRVRYLPQSLYHLPVFNPRRLFASTLPHVARQVARGTVGLAGNPLAGYYLATFLIFAMSVMAYTPFAVWQRQVLGNSVAMVFLVGMTNSVASALTFRWVGRQIRKYGSLRVQMATVSARVLTFVGFALIGWLGITGMNSLILLILLNALSGLGWAGIAVAGNSTVAHLAPRGSEGAAVGAYTSFVSIGSILGALVSGYFVLAVGYEVVFVAGAIGIAITVLMLALIRRMAPAEARAHL
jgi:MFS family permease